MRSRPWGLVLVAACSASGPTTGKPEESAPVAAGADAAAATAEPDPMPVTADVDPVAMNCEPEPSARATDSPERGAAATGPRQTIVISDLHMGLGRVPGTQTWEKKEDFRWPNALCRFLGHIRSEARKEGAAGIDLVIAGDFLELWQPSPEVKCAGPGEGATAVDPGRVEGWRGGP